jgi:hypothetical protein
VDCGSVIFYHAGETYLGFQINVFVRSNFLPVALMKLYKLQCQAYPKVHKVQVLGRVLMVSVCLTDLVLLF